MQTLSSGPDLLSSFLTDGFRTPLRKLAATSSLSVDMMAGHTGTKLFCLTLVRTHLPDSLCTFDTIDHSEPSIRTTHR